MSDVSQDSKSSAEKRSQQYSIQIRKSKNIEIAMALSSYIFICNKVENYSPALERYCASILCSTFPSIRMAVFDRLWSTLSSQVTASLDLFYARRAPFTAQETKQINNFVTSIVLASFYRRKIQVEDSFVAETLICLGLQKMIFFSSKVFIKMKFS